MNGSSLCASSRSCPRMRKSARDRTGGPLRASRLSVVFFTDRDLGIAFPAILAAAGLSVERHRDHFPPDCADERWLEVVGQRGWVALTHDRHIRYKPNELAGER